MILALAAFAPAAIAFAAYPGDQVAPPLDRPIRQRMTETRDDGRGPRRYAIERLIRFARGPGGLRATVIMTTADCSGDAAECAQYRAANAPMLGFAYVVLLADDGRAVGVVDLDTVWARWTKGLAAAGNGAVADAMRARLAALSAAQRTAMVGATVAALFAPASDRAPAPPRPASVRSLPPFADTALTGTTTVAAAGPRVAVTTRTAGAVGPAAENARAEHRSEKLVDPGTALIVSDQTTATLTGTRIRLSVRKAITLSW